MAASMRNRKVILAILLILRNRRRRRRNRNIWVRSWISRREEYGVFANLIQELRTEDPEMYRRYFRVNVDGFNTLLQKVGPTIQKQDTQLAVTLRYLATGETFTSLSFAYRIGETTISSIVTETCSALYECLKEEHLKAPSTEEEWMEISQNFRAKWNYPFCMGAIDGKHITIRKPPNSVSEYFNYKHFFSILLLAVVNADYKFIYIDVGATGRSGDAGVFADSTLKRVLDAKELSFRPPAELDGTCLKCNYHIIGDDAFPLRTDMMKPFPHRNLSKDQRIFNYRFSRARRVVENAFGILANKFVCF